MIGDAIEYGNPLHGKRVLMVYAHCDDELVCGWPVLQDNAIHKSVLITSSDRHHPKRQWCGHRRNVTLDLCRWLDIPARVLDYDSDFYSLDYRNGPLREFEHAVLRAIGTFDFDYIMTHNPFGEYGHLDHRFLSDLVIRTADRPVLTTDIVLPSAWTDVPPRSAAFDDLFFRNRISTSSIDMAFYMKVQRYYETRGTWTWSIPPVPEASVYRL